MSGGGNPDKADDGVIVFFMICGILIGFPWVVWHFWHTEISWGLGWMRWQQAKLFMMWDPQGATTVMKWLSQTHPSTHTVEQLFGVAGWSGGWLRWLIGPGLLYLAWKAYDRQVDLKFRRTFGNGVDSLLFEQSKTWRTILPFTVENPATDTSGRWLPAMNIEQWMKWNGIPIRGFGITAALAAGEYEKVGLNDISLISMYVRGLTYVDKTKKTDDEFGTLDYAFISNELSRLGYEYDTLEMQSLGIDAKKMKFAICQTLALRAALERQLSQPWQGPGAMMPHQQALFAVLALLGDRQQSLGNHLRDRLAEVYTAEVRRCKAQKGARIDMDGAIRRTPDVWRMVQGVLRDKPDMYLLPAPFWPTLREALGKSVSALPNVVKAWKALMGWKWLTRRKAVKKKSTVMDKPLAIAADHAYVQTVFISLLIWARSRIGVIPPAEYVWLKPVNRPFWYVISGVGSRVAWPESSGVVSHWKAEVLKGKPIIDPHTDEAMDGIRKHFVESD